MSEQADHDLIVIGAGPAGMAAAVAAARHDLDVVLLDEQPAPGGQVFRNVEAVVAKSPSRAALLGRDYGYGAAFVDALRQSSVDYRPETGVWQIAEDGTVGTLSTAGAALISGRRVVIATGAMERPVPIPGWTLPGVMTAGAAQTLLKTSNLVPDGRVVLVGSGPLFFLVARQLLAADADIVGVLDTTSDENYQAAQKVMLGALKFWRDLLKGRRWMREITKSGVPFHHEVQDVRILGQDRASGVSFEAKGVEYRLEADMVLLHEGVVPDQHLARSLDCRERWDEEQLCWHIDCDDWGATSLERIAVAGDCGSIGGAAAASHRGRLAGLDAAMRLGAIDEATRDRLGQRDLKADARLAGLRLFLDRLYRPRSEVLVPPDDAVVVCRCEEVTAGALRQAAALGVAGPNQAKAFTRAGMGPCQGRNCGLTVAAILADAEGKTAADMGQFRVRPPIKPITVDQLADLAVAEPSD